MNNAGKLLKGKDGYVWLGGTPISAVQSVEIKISGNWEEYSECGDPNTYNSLNGYSGSGSIKVKKLDSSLNNLIAAHIRGDGEEDFNITTKINGKGGELERIRINGVTFDEVTLAAFETGKASEDEYPFKFVDFEYLDRIGGDFDGYNS